MAGQSGQPCRDWSQPGHVEAVDPAPSDEFAADQAGLPEYPEVAADGGPGNGKQRRDLAGAQITAGQRGQDLSAGRVSHRGKHVHDPKA